MLLRLLTTALCAACVVLLAALPVVRLAVISPAVAPPGRVSAACRHDRVAPLAVVDVAGAVAPSGIVALLHLRPGEYITAVNDRDLDPDLPPGPLIAELAPPPGGFLDLTVSSPRGDTERRVLVLLH